MLKGTFLLVLIVILHAPGMAQDTTLKDLMSKGQGQHGSGDYAAAQKTFEAARTLAAGEFGKQNTNYGLTCYWLAYTHHLQSHPAEAESLYLETKEVWGATLGKEHPAYVNNLNNLGWLYEAMGDDSKAEPIYLQVKELKAKTPGKSSQEYASVLDDLAGLYVRKGNDSEAELLYKEAKSILEKTAGKEDESYTNLLGDLALLYKSTGNYASAEALFLELKQIQEMTMGKENEGYAGTLNYLGLIYTAMGNYAKAETVFLTAIEIQEKVLGKEDLDYAATLTNLGIVYANTAKYANAERLYNQAKAIRETKLGKQSYGYANSLNNLSILYKDMGDYMKARTYVVEANEILAKVLGKEHPDYARTLKTLSLFYKSIGNYPKAEAYQLEAKEVDERTLGRQHPDYVTDLNNLALVYEAMKNNDRAEVLYQELITLSQSQISRVFPSMSEKEKQDYYADNVVYFANFEMFCVARYAANPLILSDLYNERLATKGILFNTSNKIRQRILLDKDQALIKDYNDWKAKKDFLAKVYRMSVREKQKSGLDQRQLEEDANALEKKLSLQSELFAQAADSKQYSWVDVRQKLKADEVAVEIIQTQRRVNDIYTSVYVALLVTPQTKDHPQLIVLENGDELDTKFSRYYRNAIQQKLEDRLSYNQYWKPIAEKTAGARKVYFSADGVYNQINLSTLFNPETNKYVMDETEIHMVTSTKDILTSSKKANAQMRNATLFGYPNYNTTLSRSQGVGSVLLGVKETTEIKKDSAQRFFNGENITELPGTKVEVETIESLLKAKNISMHQYMFDKATETELKNQNNPQVLHIATHGFFLSNVEASEDDDSRILGIETKTVVSNPLLRSGLLFAGAKQAFNPQRGTDTGDDGILSAYEAMSLNLDETDLVVMSACETGLGVTKNGEGVYGLQTAFQVAGAKAVLMSLWTVSDEATQKLMTEFYENWLTGIPPREAFNRAQSSIRSTYAEPYYWGAFVMMGD